MRDFLHKLKSIKFTRDIATMQVGQVIITACGFLSSVLYTRLLGLDGYGLYATVLAFVGVFGLITNFGQYSTTLTFLAEALGRKDKIEIRSVLQYYMVMSAGSAIVLGVVIAIAAPITSAIYDSEQIGRLATIVFASSIIDPIFIFVTTSLQSVREIRLMTLLENGRSVTQLGLSVLLLILGYGVAGILLGTLIGTAVFALLAILLYGGVAKRHALPHLPELLLDWRTSKLRRYMKRGLWIALDKNVGNQYPNLFLFALSTMTSQRVVGLVRLGFKLGNLPSSFVLTNISRLSGSVIPGLLGKGMEEMRRGVLRIGRYALALHLGATLCAAIIVPPLIPYVYGAEYDVAMYPFWIFAGLHILLAIHAMMTPVLRATDRTYYAVFSNVAGFILSLSLYGILLGFLSPLRALYIAIAFHHLIILYPVFPVWKLMCSARLPKR